MDKNIESKVEETTQNNEQEKEVETVENSKENKIINDNKTNEDISDDKIEEIFSKKMKELEDKYKVKENNLILKHLLKENNLDDCIDYINITSEDNEETIQSKVQAELDRINKILNKLETNTKTTKGNTIPRTQNTKNSRPVEKSLNDKLIGLFK